MKTQFAKLSLLLSAAIVVGCDAGGSVDVIDLNKVLDALAVVLDESASPNSAPATVSVAGTDGQPDAGANLAAIPPNQQDLAKEAAFLQKYADKLNEVKAMSSPVGVAFAAGGEIIGFQDPNGNNVQDTGETKEFTVTIDVENSRLVASDNNGHHRPYGFRPGGMMMGYLLGSMMGRQNSFYSGAAAAARPSFSGTQMSSPDYHKSAVSSARSRASAAPSAARARTGSKGFSFGK
ncbi:MAG: hypothetical protein ACK56W_21460 [Pirellula sp.]|jgi:hypothetical protein|nr:hypothetical protein [Pirellula sp.]